LRNTRFREEPTRTAVANDREKQPVRFSARCEA